MRVLTTSQRLAVLHLLIEGNSIRSTERITGVHRDTICRLLGDLFYLHYVPDVPNIMGGFTQMVGGSLSLRKVDVDG